MYTLLLGWVGPGGMGPPPFDEEHSVPPASGHYSSSPSPSTCTPVCASSPCAARPRGWTFVLF
eukprot:6375457-Pyramimonas_sp.AAC.1